MLEDSECYTSILLGQLTKLEYRLQMKVMSQFPELITALWLYKIINLFLRNIVEVL